MYVCVYVRMSRINSKGRPLSSQKWGAMDTVIPRGRHRPCWVWLRHLPRPGGMFLSDPLLVASGKSGNFEASHLEKIRESASDGDLN